MKRRRPINTLKWYLWHCWHRSYWTWRKDGNDAVCDICRYRVVDAAHEVREGVVAGP